jgi:hypothetical protein
MIVVVHVEYDHASHKARASVHMFQRSAATATRSISKRLLPQ